MKTTAKIIDFESEPLHPALERFPANRRFPLRLWQPGGEHHVEEIAILTHGFLEGVEADPKRRERMLKRYEFIAAELNARGIAAVFLPLPFHFERGNDLAAAGTFAPIERLREDGTYLYRGGYDQAVSDIVKLADDIDAAPDRFGLPRAHGTHLVGYSLGGAAALGAGTRLGRRLASLSALFSTWRVASIDPGIIEETFGEKYGFGRAEWTRVMEQLAHHRHEYDEVFQDLVWGDGSGSWISLCPTRMLFVHGLEDEIFTTALTLPANFELYEYVRRINRSAGNGPNRECVFIAPMTDHWHMRERKQVAGYVASFIANPGQRGDGGGGGGSAAAQVPPKSGDPAERR